MPRLQPCGRDTRRMSDASPKWESRFRLVREPGHRAANQVRLSRSAGRRQQLRAPPRVVSRWCRQTTSCATRCSAWRYSRCSIVAKMVGALLAVMLAAAADQPIGPGVSESIARERAEHFRNVRYELVFTIPADRRTPVEGRIVVRVSLAAPHRIALDFEQPRDHVQSVRVHGLDIGVSVENGHLIIPAVQTVAGENEIEIRFVAGDEALNRNEDFLYTLHVPARARYTFPCFDQPDIKARYALKLLIPAGWKVGANGAATETRGVGPAGAPGTWNDLGQFSETEPLPTYLFAFVAGKFSIET